MADSGVSFQVAWEAPPIPQLNISNCSAVTPWFAGFLTGSTTESGWELAPYGTAVDFVTSLVPDNWTTPSAADAIVWYTAMAQHEYFDDGMIDALVSFSIYECGSSVCPHLDWDGDADLSGIGMLISYYIAAVFATIYYIVLAPEVCAAFGRRPFGFSSKRYSRFAAGFEESLQGFLDAMLLFAISMLVAAVTRYVSVIKEPDKPYSLYGLLDCVFLSSFSVFPAFVLQSLSYELRRRRIRLFMWFMVLAWAIAVDVLYNKKYLSIFETDEGLLGFLEQTTELGQYVWLADCQSGPLLARLQASVAVGHAVMVANGSWWVYHVVAAGLGGRRWAAALRRRAGPWRAWERARLWLRLGNGLLCLAVMWTFLGLFTVYRADVSRRAGSADEANEWLLGQVLALATFVPVGIDLVVVYIYGAKDGLTGKMSRRYKVVDRSQEDILRDNVFVGTDEYEQAGTEEKYPPDVKYAEPSSEAREMRRSRSWSEEEDNLQVGGVRNGV